MKGVARLRRRLVFPESSTLPLLCVHIASRRNETLWLWMQHQMCLSAWPTYAWNERWHVALISRQPYPLFIKLSLATSVHWHLLFNFPWETCVLVPLCWGTLISSVERRKRLNVPPNFPGRPTYFIVGVDSRPIHLFPGQRLLTVSERWSRPMTAPATRARQKSSLTSTWSNPHCLRGFWLNRQSERVGK